jgi:GntR family transcriptional regulator
VRDALAERIASGVWKPGMAVANEGDLARELGVSAGTTRKALELMESQRLITRRQGRGTFVSDQTATELAARYCNFRSADGERVYGRLASVEVVEGTADGHECQRLYLAAGAAVYRIRRVRRLGERNFMVEDATVPAALFPGLPGRREVAGNVSALAQDYGILLGKAQERISLARPPAKIAQTLGVAPGTPVMLRDRLMSMLDGSPLEWGMSHWHLADGYYLAEMN